MKKRLLIILAILTIAITASAQTKRQTIVIRDGKLIDAKNITDIDGLLAGTRAFLGVTLNDITPELREHFGAPKDAGVIVESVQPDSPAEKAGIKVGDIVLSADGKDVKSSADLRAALREKKEGDSVRLEVLRGRSRQTIVASVKERETPRMLQLDELPGVIGTPEWRARIERLGDCNDLQSRIKELETRLKDLEKKLQK